MGRGLFVVATAVLGLATGCTGGEAGEGDERAAPVASATIRWVAIGDSYTKGEAARRDEAWPYLAAERLRAEGHAIDLVDNLGVTGDTARDVIREQVPKLAALKPDLITLQVGINDLVQGVDEARFRKNLGELLDTLLERVPAGRLIVVTIPDFSVARKAPRFGKPAEIQEGILRRNAILADEASKRKLEVADIYPTSRAAAKDPTLLAMDGIHPSAKGYAAWVDDVMPALRKATAPAPKKPVPY